LLATWLILLSALLHASWNLAIRRSRDSVAATVVVVAGSALLAGGVACFQHGAPPALLSATQWGLAAGLFEGIYFFALGRALQIGPLGPVYAVSRGLPLLLLWPVSHAALGEAVSLRSAFSVALLLLGLVALAPSRGPGQGTTRAGYGWACLCAGAIAGNTLLYKVALVRGADVLVLFTVADVTALPVAVLGIGSWAHLWPRIRAAWSELPLALSLAAVASSVSFLLTLYVMRGQGAAWVVTLRNSSIAFAQLLSWIWLGERPSKRVLAGVGLVLAGALLLGF